MHVRGRFELCPFDAARAFGHPQCALVVGTHIDQDGAIAQVLQRFGWSH
jgi:hypothetical protein